MCQVSKICYIFILLIQPSENKKKIAHDGWVNSSRHLTYTNKNVQDKCSKPIELVARQRDSAILWR